MKKVILIGLSILALPLSTSCGKDDGPTPEPQPKAVEITGFSPASGEVDTEVTINGKNFSTTMTENVITFNETTATVKSATASTLKVDVPSGATTGKIKVTVGSSSATSATDFEVLESTPALTIGGFTPTKGEWGTEVTITGSGFSLTKDENEVSFNGTLAEISSVTANQLVVLVPNEATSGVISLSVNGQAVQSNNDFDVYTVANWTKLDTSYPTNHRTHGVSFVIDGIIYSGLGQTSDELKEQEIWAYDANLNTWEQKMDFPVQERLTSSAVFVLNGKAYVVGGAYVNNGDSSEVWAFDPNSGDSGTWTLMDTPFPGSGKVGGTGFSIGEKGYVAGGGYDTGEGSELVNEVWEYNLSDDSWTQKNNFTGPTFHRGLAMVLGSKSYVHLSRTGTDGNGSSDWWEYDPASDVWSKRADIPGKRTGAFGFSINGRAYLGFGSYYDQNTNTYYQDFMEYDPETDSWSTLVSPSYTSLVLAEGNGLEQTGILGLGITDENGPSDDFWRFTPSTKL